MKYTIRNLIVLMIFLVGMISISEAQSRRQTEKKEESRKERVEPKKNNKQQKKQVANPARTRRPKRVERQRRDNDKKVVSRKTPRQSERVQRERRREKPEPRVAPPRGVNGRKEIRRNRPPVDRDNRIIRNRKPVQRRTVQDRPRGRRYNDRYYGDYWRRYPKRKKHYIKFGWSPLYCLNLVPTIRFDIYTRPYIYNRTQIVFVKEYDRYDYSPGDPVGYAVHINFSGRVRVYDRYYDRQQVLAKEFYLSNWELRKLRRTLDRGDYYDDNVCLLDEYGSDRNPAYATIAYRPTPNHRMRKVAFNLAAPIEYYPDYLCDFMEEVDDILYDCGFFSTTR